VRVPFLDWDLVAACQQRTAPQLMPFGQAKHALKRLAVGIVPDRVIARRKSGFQLDVVDASGSTLAPLFDRYLSEDVVAQHRLFNFSFIKEVMQHRADRRWRWHFFLLYLMAQSHIFMDEYDLA
jgi:asparagine synthase (glutamine-hydrolysing)